MKIIFDYNRTIFDPEKDCLYPGALSLLANVSARHELFLISRKEPSREGRIRELGIEKYFRKILFVEKKTGSLFKDILNGAANALVVGDRIADEIKIGNQLGLITIRIKNGKFGLESPVNEDEAADHEIRSLADLKTIIEGYE